MKKVFLALALALGLYLSVLDGSYIINALSSFGVLCLSITTGNYIFEWSVNRG